MDPLLKRALESGSPADLQAVSEWWASGLHTRSVEPDVARTLVDRGAILTVHAAAGIGLTDHLTRMLDADPSLIDAKGCDACTPLHFSRDIATARLLLDRGARIEARDEDHESTPVQWLIRDAPDVVPGTAPGEAMSLSWSVRGQSAQVMVGRCATRGFCAPGVPIALDSN